MADNITSTMQLTAPHTIPLSDEQEKQYELIVRNLQEVTSADILRKVISERAPVGYWGTAITGRPHIAYCLAQLKIADLLNAGCIVKVLLADLHGFLDGNKSEFSVLTHRTVYYKKLLTALQRSLGVPTDGLIFVRGMDYQLTPEYTLDMYKFHTLVTMKNAEHAGAEVVKESESPLMSSLMYPGLQCLDEQHLGVDFQLGGVDQRKIFMYAAEYLPKLGYEKRAHLMNPMVPGLSGAKMSSSDPKSKIDFLDKPSEVKSKIKAALCTPGVIEGNGVLAFVKTVLIPVQEMREAQAQARGESEGPRGEGSFVSNGAPPGTLFSIARPEKFGGDMHFPSYQALEDAYAKEELHPGDLKAGTTDALIKLLAPIQRDFEADAEWQEAERMGYPNASVQVALASAKQGAGEKLDGKKRAKDKEIRSKPPTEEERAALRAQKEQEKLAKAQAEDGPGLEEIQQQAAKMSVSSPVASGSGSGNGAIAATSMPKLRLLAKGKVRDIYALPDEVDSDKLLFVATDRISAFDVIMENGIPQKGITLTTLSLFWFRELAHIIPNHVLIPSLQPSSSSTSSPTHLPTALTDPSSTWNEFPRGLDEYRDQLEGRSMIVRKCEVVKIEAIVRGYITGSAWAEYKTSQTVHGIPMPPGLVESQKLEKPLFTPSTKADQGEHDENIHPDKVKDICGPEIAAEIERIALQLYTEASEYALQRGLILADTKFEFGLLPSPPPPPSSSSSLTSKSTSRLILIDELLTPDSSRYWSLDLYTPGKPQPSFDKQYLRDWLLNQGLKNVPGVRLPEDVVRGTKVKYEEARDRVMGLGAFGDGVHGRKGVIVDEGEAGLQTDQVADAVSGLEKGKAGGVHGRKGVKVDEGEAGLQTDQVTDAVSGLSEGESKGVHGKKGVVVDAGEAGIQTDQVADAVSHLAE